jgi:3-oxoacyl-[acyl-carrier protein] reductase
MRAAAVTGACKGIGFASASELAGRGMSVVTLDVDGHQASQAAKRIEAQGGTAFAVQADVTNAGHVCAALEVVRTRFGALRARVNNAGFPMAAMLHRKTDSEWYAVIDVCLNATFLVSRAAAPLLGVGTTVRPSRHRKVVNISSLSGIHGTATSLDYSAAKAGVIRLTRALAREWAPARINVNAVAPGVHTGHAPQPTAARGV